MRHIQKSELPEKIMRYDTYYPRQLFRIERSPEILYFRGDFSIVHDKSVAVIGSRQASHSAIQIAYQTGYKLAKEGICVVNGLALGCDTHALRGALSAKGHCIAVLPCGLDQIRPASNIGLAREILAQGGCLLSEYPVGSSVQKYHYVARDRIQSGLSKAVIVIETGCDSGTMHTVNYAIQQGRQIACYSSSLVGNTAGNQWLESRKFVRVLHNTADLEQFIKDIDTQQGFEQMVLQDIMIEEG